MKIKATAPLETTDKNDVVAMGAPSYTSAVHKWNGTTESLNANAVKRKTNASICMVHPYRYWHLFFYLQHLDLNFLY